MYHFLKYLTKNQWHREQVHLNVVFSSLQIIWEAVMPPLLGPNLLLPLELAKQCSLIYSEVYNSLQDSNNHSHEVLSV